MDKKIYERKDSSRISELVSTKKDPHEIIAEVAGPAYTEYRKIWESAVRFESKVTYPLHIDFEMTAACNLKCQMCVMKLPNEDRIAYSTPGEKLPFEMFKKIIDEGVPCGLKSVGLNAINEPLLSKDLVKWIAYAKEKGVLDIMFNTNGVLLNEKIAEQLIKSGLTRIMISIDAATAETYKRVRRSDDYELIKMNVENFIALRNRLGCTLPIVRLSFVKMSNNIHELQQFLELWQDKVDFFSIQRYGNPFVPGEKDYEECEELHVDKEIEDIGFKCPQPWAKMVVKANGDLNPCCGLQGPKLVYGNAHKDRIEDVWNSSRMDLLREIHKEGRYRENETCRLCAASSKYA